MAFLMMVFVFFINSRLCVDYDALHDESMLRDTAAVS